MTDYTWPTALVPYEVSFYLQPHTGGSESPFSRATKVYGLSAPRWVCSLSIRAPDSQTRWGGSFAAWGETLDAFLAKMKGRLNRVPLWDFRRPGGTKPFTNNAVAAGDVSMTLVGASTGQIRVGEYIGGDGRPHIITQLDVSGSDLIAKVEPPFVGMIAAGAAVYEKVSGFFRLVSDDSGSNATQVGELTEYRLEFVEDNDYMAAADGTWPYQDTPTIFDLTRENTSTGSYIRTSPFASVTYTTSSTRLLVTAYNNIWSVYPHFAEIGLVVDGVHQSLLMGATGSQTIEVFLGSGSHTIQLINGLQAGTGSAGGAITGTWLTSVQGDRPLVRTANPNDNLLLFYGDSIAVGDTAIHPTGKGFTMLTRFDAARSVGVEGHGSRNLNEDAVDATARTAFVAKIVAWNPAELWIQIGTNDYGLNKWSAASFGTAYAALLDALHTALPSLHIYAQSPIVRVTETANGSGSTLGNYRTQISTAAAARTSYVTFVDGTTILSTSNLGGDGVHPTTAGHAIYADFIPTIVALGESGPELIAKNSNTTISIPVAGTYRITKTGGGGSFNTGARGTVALDGDFTIKVVPNEYVVDILVGITSRSSSSTDYRAIDHAVYFSGAGTALVYHAGVSTSTLTGNYSSLNPAWIVREGGEITFRYGATVGGATVVETIHSTERFYLDSALFTVSEYVDVTIT